MSFVSTTQTDTGRQRDHNEDAVHANKIEQRDLLAVADGMGGHNAGSVASETALSAFTQIVQSDLRAGESTEETLLRGVREANERVRSKAEEKPEFDGMGTTLVGAIVDRRTAEIVTVGDSRAYHISGGDIEQITTDHSLVNELVEEGVIEQEEMDNHPQRHVLSQAVGTNNEIEPDYYRIQLTGTLLICSDGLTEEVPESEIHEIVAGGESPQTTADLLVNRANEYGGSDNITVALGRYQ